MMFNRIPSNHEVVVLGRDMFGVQFSEKTRVQELRDEGFTFLLFRPIEEKLALEVNFHPDAPEAGYWIRGIIFKVKNYLDGTQLVELRDLQLPQNLVRKASSGQ